ncbi:hypothetical protein [Nonomuraea sp. GTA35]|uniref:hypothetical protein n=1 Tax=Nonomuraea sp. GTA35 TaxID=1676746 RepID=UPI0035C009E1
MELGFWAGLALSIPIGIGVNLATPWFQRLIARRSKKAADKRKRELEMEKLLVTKFKADPIAYQSFLYISLVRVLVYFAIAVLSVTLPYPLTDFLMTGQNITGLVPLPPLSYLNYEATFNVIGVILANISMILLLNNGRRARRIAGSLLNEPDMLDLPTPSSDDT